MPAPKGHPRWGNPRKPKKLTPKQLWEGACNYFDWADKNPIMVVEQVKMPQKLTSNMLEFMKSSQVKGFMKQTIELPHQRAYSIEGLCIFLNIDSETFANYSNKKGYETYFGICKHIRNIIDTQHLEGGLSGIFNANIVRMKLGLTEKKSLTIQSEQPLFPDDDNK